MKQLSFKGKGESTVQNTPNPLTGIHIFSGNQQQPKEITCTERTFSHSWFIQQPHRKVFPTSNRKHLEKRMP